MSASHFASWRFLFPDKYVLALLVRRLDIWPNFYNDRGKDFGPTPFLFMRIQLVQVRFCPVLYLTVGIDLSIRWCEVAVQYLSDSRRERKTTVKQEVAGRNMYALAFLAVSNNTSVLYVG
ncbi:hypothetical protein NVS47_12950 [Dehalobacterium formicoaceticum]|uniref:Uncharacterized protein n=1 Tax=Dehalobacterium formicoaceticum TaxID=51515 RepID=A0ABT1Y699_9FIRM|nr:hypothetical protein [Dehalobacterium formicoaceticum]MCR6546407.1 hypothetical protein [Dehalobacterium formicoaceticum]